MYRNHMHKNSCNYSCDLENNCECDDNKYMETECYNVASKNNCYDECECGFEEENLFPNNPMFGQSYVPFQQMNKTFIPCVGLKMGTIFPELVSPYMPGQSQAEINYIADNNIIKEGCNKC